jgi:hypothetical protein
MTITDFLLARIAEDEAAARACVDEEADVFEAHEDDSDWHVSVKGGMHVANLGRTTWHGTGELARHIARHDPARVLAECEAKRWIVKEHSDDYGHCATCYAGDDGACGDPDCCGSPTAVMKLWPCPTVRLLTLPYADHPDFKPGWKI